MTVEYKTRKTCNGLSLQIAKVASNKYVQIIRNSDNMTLRRFNDAPFVGSLRELYSVFEFYADQSLEGEIKTWTKAQRITVQAVYNTLIKDIDSGNWKVNKTGYIQTPTGHYFR